MFICFLFVYQYLQVLLFRSTLNQFVAQTVFVLGITLTQLQDLGLVFIELHEVFLVAPIKTVHVPLNGIPALQHFNQAT